METLAVKYIKENKKNFLDSYIKNINPQTKKTALFTAGCSGAGKTEYATYRLTQDVNLLHIDTDRVRSFFIPIGYNGKNAEIFQPAASIGVEKLVDESLKKRLSIIHDTNFCDYSKQKKNIERCLNKGYEVTIVYVLVELSKAYTHVLARETEIQRHVPEKKIPETLIGSIKTTAQIKSDFGSDICLNVIDRRYGLRKEHINIEKNDFEELVHIESIEAENDLLRYPMEESLQLSAHRYIDFLQAHTLRKAYELISPDQFQLDYLSGMNRIAQLMPLFQNLTQSIVLDAFITPLPKLDYLNSFLEIDTSLGKALETYSKISNPFKNMNDYVGSALRDSYKAMHINKTLGLGDSLSNTFPKRVEDIFGSINNPLLDSFNSTKDSYDMSLYTDFQKLLDSTNPYKQLMDSLPFGGIETAETALQKFNKIKQMRIKANKLKYYQLFSKILGYEYLENSTSSSKKDWLMYLKANLEQIKTFFDDDGKILKDFYKESDQIELVKKCLIDKKWILAELRKECLD
jgi:UDP-N-acetylglucosamine kinase